MTRKLVLASIVAFGIAMQANATEIIDNGDGTFALNNVHLEMVTDHVTILGYEMERQVFVDADLTICSSEVGAARESLWLFYSSSTVQPGIFNDNAAFENLATDLAWSRIAGWTVNLQLVKREGCAIVSATRN